MHKNIVHIIASILFASKIYCYVNDLLNFINMTRHVYILVNSSMSVTDLSLY